MVVVDSVTARTCLTSGASAVSGEGSTTATSVEDSSDDEGSPCMTMIPESAYEDNHHELRVFALRQVQSRFSGRYNQLVVCRYTDDSCCTDVMQQRRQQQHKLRCTTSKAVSAAAGGVAQTLTPHRECLVLPQHLPELRSVVIICCSRLLVVSQLKHKQK